MHQNGQTIDDADLEQLVNLFRLLADKTRLRILVLLKRGERNVTSICHELALAQPTVSHHLGLLRTCNIVLSRRNGKQVFYALNRQGDGTVGSAMHAYVERFSVSVLPR